MKFWNEMSEKQTLLDDDVIMIGDSAETTKPKHAPLSTIISWIKNKLGTQSIPTGNLPVANADGTLTDSGQRPVKICSDYNHFITYEMEILAYRDTTNPFLILEAKNPDTGEYYEIDKNDTLRFYVAIVNYGTTVKVAKTYQDNQVSVRFKDKNKGTIYEKVLQTLAAEEISKNTTVKDVYGACFEISLNAGDGDYLYPRVKYNLKGDKLINTTIVADTTVALTNSNPTYTVSTDTAATVKLIAETTGCSVTLPTTLQEDQSVIFIIPENSKAVTIGGTLYQPGDTVFCAYMSGDSDNPGIWSVNNTKTPIVPDYTDVNVKWVLGSAYTSYKGPTGIGKVSFSEGTFPENDTAIKGQLVFVKEKIPYQNQAAAVKYDIQPGLYYIYDTAEEKWMYLSKLCDTTALSIITCDNENGKTQKGIWKKIDSSNGTYFEEIDQTKELLSNKVSAITDANKTSTTQYPTVAALQTALSTKADLVSGKVPAAQLPSYVDDVIEGYYSSSVFYSDEALTTAIAGETGKIYVDLSTNYTYRYTGTVYVRINEIDFPISIEQGGTGSSTKNFVDLITDQTIAGTKNFTGTITTGGLGVKIGANAASVATGSYWTAVGQEAGYLNTTGIFWVAIGNSAGAYNATGSHWVAIGELAGMYNATGSYWTAVGQEAGTYNTTGSSATSFSNSTYFGSNTRVSDNGVENENVFGNTANGMGSNTVSLGNSSCTGLYFAGNKFLDNNKGLTVNQAATAIHALTDATTISFALTSGANATLTLTDAVTARTINASAGIAGAECRIIITQSSTATYPAVTWGTMFKFPGDTAPVLNTSANGVTMLEFFFDGTYYRLRNVVTYNS